MCHSTDMHGAIPSTQDVVDGPDGPYSPGPEPCWGRKCTVTNDNILSKYPNLRFLPRPEPTQANSADHTAWLGEFQDWGSLQCGCGRGYFCREHGDWISGPEVGSGTAVRREEQKNGCCPAHHYQDPVGRVSYVGKRDGIAV